VAPRFFIFGGADIFITNVAADMNFNSSGLQRRSDTSHPFNNPTYVIHYTNPSSGIRHVTDTSPHNILILLTMNPSTIRRWELGVPFLIIE